MSDLKRHPVSDLERPKMADLPDLKRPKMADLPNLMRPPVSNLKRPPALDLKHRPAFDLKRPLVFVLKDSPRITRFVRFKTPSIVRFKRPPPSFGLKRPLVFDSKRQVYPFPKLGANAFAGNIAFSDVKK